MSAVSCLVCVVVTRKAAWRTVILYNLGWDLRTQVYLNLNLTCFLLMWPWANYLAFPSLFPCMYNEKWRLPLRVPVQMDWHNKQPDPEPHVGDQRMSNLWQYSGEDSRFYYLQNRTVSLKCDSLPLCHGAQESGICARDLETHQCTCAHHFSWRGGQSVRRDQKNA